MFKAVDSNDRRFYLFATLGHGVLRFEVVAALPDGTRGAVHGKQFFEAMMVHFGARIRMIEGSWNAANGLTTNLDLFNRATSAGLALLDAAAFTWTGLRAAEYGFSPVSITASPPGAVGRFDTVRVEFRQ